MKADYHKDTLLSINYLRSYTRKEVFKYIRKLHRIVKRQQRKLQQYKHKIKFLSHIKSPQQTNAESEVVKEDKQEPKAAAKTFLEEITEAAETAQNNTDFVYEPTSGLYYDQRTGYYYNAEYGLYYDGATGCYYRYNQENNEFEFHSQVQIQSSKTAQVSNSSYLNNLLDLFSNLNIKHMRANALGKFITFSWSENTYFFVLQGDGTGDNRSHDSDRIKNGNSKRKRKKRNKRVHNSKDYKERRDFEDGEISSSSKSEYDETEIVISDSNSGDVQSKYEDVAKKYPPSLRIIVQETNLPKLKIGTLFLITFKGGSLGREGTHDVIIPDVNVSKFHLKFTYDETESVYKCTDLGSRNGTLLNGKRMSNAKQESEPISLVHGSILILSQTKLLCHIHSGNSTCGHCEPGLIIDQSETDKVVTLSHKAQLKVLQKRYGLENEKYINASKNKTDPNYADRAAERRDKVGSTNEYEKTEMASLETAISSKNKGFEMLSKLGWSKGESLGKGKGLLEPIKLINNEGTTGLGCDKPNVSISFLRKDQRKLAALSKTRQRYSQLNPSNIFLESDDSSD